MPYSTALCLGWPSTMTVDLDHHFWSSSLIRPYCWMFSTNFWPSCYDPLPCAKCLRFRKLQIWSPIIAKGTVDLAVGWALLNLKQHLTKHTEEKMEIYKVKSAHHATRKNVGFGCSTNAKVRGENLINIISIELMTSSARDASFKSPKTPINDGNMELRILQFKENIFHFPIWRALLLLVDNMGREINQLHVTSYSLWDFSLTTMTSSLLLAFPAQFSKVVSVKRFLTVT